MLGLGALALLVGAWSSGFEFGRRAAVRNLLPALTALKIEDHTASAQGAIDGDLHHVDVSFCPSWTVRALTCLTISADGVVSVKRDGEHVGDWPSVAAMPDGERRWWTRMYRVYRLTECRSPDAEYKSVPNKPGSDRTAMITPCGWESS